MDNIMWKKAKVICLPINDINSQHLYIVSDDEIKAGDWKIVHNNKVKQHKEGDFVPHYGIKHQKIIATTDKSLTKLEEVYFDKDKTRKSSVLCQNILPSIPREFIRKYYEYEGELWDYDEIEVEYIVEEYSRGVSNPTYEKEILKINLNNTINIRFTHQKLYTKEDMFKAFSHYAFTSLSTQPYNEKELKEEFQKFIKNV